MVKILNKGVNEGYIMMVIMNSKGQYAHVSQGQTHAGMKWHLSWNTGLNSATLFENKIHKRSYEGIFDELMRGIFIPATVTRVVTLAKHPENQST
jgi:hypothetical protein